MSKASQRREAERQNRLQKKLGITDSLMRELVRRGEDVMFEPVLMWSLTAEAGGKLKKTVEFDKLCQLMDRNRTTIETLVSSLRSCEIDAPYDDEPSDLPLPGIAILGSLAADVRAEFAPMSVVGFPHRSLDELAKMLFERIDAIRADAHTFDAMIWVFGLHSASFPTICLALSRSGHRAARIYVEGKWITAKNVDQVWRTAGAAARADTVDDIHEDATAFDSICALGGDVASQIDTLFSHPVGVAVEEANQALEVTNRIALAIAHAQVDLTVQVARMVDSLRATDESRRYFQNAVNEIGCHTAKLTRTSERGTAELERAVEREARRAEALNGQLQKAKQDLAARHTGTTTSLEQRINAFFVD